jgi:dolichol-phosphate mannosyltransferase
VRQNRQEGLFKRIGYLVFYRLLRAISELDVPLDAGDFSLMDRRVVEALRGLPERTRFVRGLRSFVGFRQIGLAYDRDAREAGRPKYTLRSLVGLAVDGLVSFSATPLRMVTYLGLTAAAIALVLTIWAFADALSNRATPRGWASLVIVVLVMGSVQLISLGIIGEYIRLIFMETKRRPTYVVRECRRRPAGPAETPAANRNGVAHDPDPGPSPSPRPDRRR